MSVGELFCRTVLFNDVSVEQLLIERIVVLADQRHESAESDDGHSWLEGSLKMLADQGKFG
jgi:hypothetical protein